MFKLTSLFLGFLILTQSAGAQNSNEGLKFRCVWEESSAHGKNYFMENPGFTLHFVSDDKAMIIDGDFFLRSYSPCWTGGFESCLFEYVYESEKSWVVDNERNTLTQSWVNQSKTNFDDGESEDDVITSGTSTLLLTENEDATITVKGDDSAGNMFEERFSCFFIN